MQAGATATGNGTAVVVTNEGDGAYTVLAVQVTGINGDTITFEGTVDGTNYVSLLAQNVATAATATTATANGIYRISVQGLAQVRARVSTYSAGTIYATGLLMCGGSSSTAGGSSVTIGAALPAGTNAIGKLAANSGVDIGDVDVKSIAAGTNNIGDVDVASLPSANVGQKAMAASLSVVPASDVADGTYIGDIKFGEGLPASSEVIGLVGASDIVVTITPTLDTNAYTSGDLLFDSTEIANAVRVNGGTCIVQSITIIDKDDQLKAMKLIFADAATDFGTVNSAPDPDDTEVATVVGHYEVSIDDSANNIDLGGASVHCHRNVGLVLKAGAATTSLWVAGMTMGAPTHTASGLVIKLGILRS